MTRLPPGSKIVMCGVIFRVRAQFASKLACDDYLPIPDRIRTDTISLYPGMLSVEDFVAKVEKNCSAKALGMP